jgi:hypothetical protein
LELFQDLVFPRQQKLLSSHYNKTNGNMITLIPKSHAGLLALFKNNLTHHKFPIDCKKLPAYGTYNRSTRKSGYLGKLFTDLDNIAGPVIYWFEAESSTEADRQFKIISSYGKKQKRTSQKIRRVVPLPNAGITGSKVLYVGKREEGKRKKDGFTFIADRMEMHLGYNPSGKNQGLQLAHWNDGMLMIHVVELAPGAEPYLTALELLFAIEFEPLLGRH